MRHSASWVKHIGSQDCVTQILVFVNLITHFINRKYQLKEAIKHGYFVSYISFDI